MISQHLLLQAQLRIRITLCHSHGGNVGHECVDHAAALGALRFIASDNGSTRWLHPLLNTANLVRECNNLDEIQNCLCAARRRHTPAHQTRAGIER